MKRREWGRDHVVIALSVEFWPSMRTMVGVLLANEESFKSLPISSPLFSEVHLICFLVSACTVPGISKLILT